MTEILLEVTTATIEPSPPPPKAELSKEEILEEMTFALRRAMTEILLEVTTEEMNAIATEVLKSETERQAKSSARKSGLQGVMANYGSDDESESGLDQDSD